jgi:DNA-binding XRE family transcriptional regulator
MKFRKAVDALCSALTHEDVAKALGVSVQTIRQARMKEESKSSRAPPPNWEQALVRLAENRVSYYRKLMDKLRKTD